jgi:hypothetical protein
MTRVRAALIGIVAVPALLMSVLVAPTSAAASARTTITMKVSNCEGCTIQPVLERTDADGVMSTYAGKTVTVKDGVAVMRVPTWTTPGMSFRLSGTTREDINAAPVVVVQYKGYKPGSVVTKAQARKAKRASGCWAGTSASRVTLRLRTMTVLMPSFPDETTTTRVKTGWLVPTADAPGNFGQATKGVIAVQDIGWPCDAG